MFVSCLELPNKDLGRREALLRLFALKMNNMGGGGGKSGGDRKKIWKEHMEKFMNVENE